MIYSVVVDVTLRDGIADPEGATIERALPALGFSGISSMRSGKSFSFTVDAVNEEAARDTALSVAERLLSNPVIERSSVRIEGAQ